MTLPGPKRYVSVLRDPKKKICYASTKFLCDFAWPKRLCATLLAPCICRFFSFCVTKISKIRIQGNFARTTRHMSRLCSTKKNLHMFAGEESPYSTFPIMICETIDIILESNDFRTLMSFVSFVHFYQKKNITTPSSGTLMMVWIPHTLPLEFAYFVLDSATFQKSFWCRKSDEIAYLGANPEFRLVWDIRPFVLEIAWRGKNCLIRSN